MLLNLAIEVMKNAYVPYSKFKVGVAIKSVNNKYYVGCNVENAAYPQGSCAEEGAISAMIASGGGKIKIIAISGAGEQLCTPCGGCRQRLREFASLQTAILICTDTQFKRRFVLNALLPSSFGPDNLM